MKKYIQSLITPDHVNSAIRGLVKFIGGVLATYGYVNQSQNTEISGIAIAVLGQAASSVFHFDNQKPTAPVVVYSNGPIPGQQVQTVGAVTVS